MKCYKCNHLHMNTDSRIGLLSFQEVMFHPGEDVTLKWYEK